MESANMNKRLASEK
jgi:hypothetical protein